MQTSVVLFSALAFLLTVAVALPADEKYTNKYDSVNLDEILASERLLNNYFKCLMDRGRCTPDASELKRHLPDALETDCSKCTEKQKEGTKKVIDHLRLKKPDLWKELQGKYDPKNIYITKYPELAR